MKNTLVILCCLASLAAGAQSNSYIVITSSSSSTNSGAVCQPTGGGSPYIQYPPPGEGLASILYSSISNCWVWTGSDTLPIAVTTNAPQFPANGSYYAVVTPDGSPLGHWLAFFNFNSAITSATLTNYFALPGDSVSFSAAGRNMGTTNSKASLAVSLDNNLLLQSPETAGAGNAWTLTGQMQWDGTNVNAFAQFNSGDPSNPVYSAYTTVTNYPVGTNAFAITTDNTNGIEVDSVTVTASRATGTPPATGRPLTPAFGSFNYAPSTPGIQIPVTATNLFARTNDAWWDVNGAAMNATNNLPNGAFTSNPLTTIPVTSTNYFTSTNFAGTLFAANIIATNGTFAGNGGGMTNLTAANIVGSLPVVEAILLNASTNQVNSAIHTNWQSSIVSPAGAGVFVVNQVWGWVSNSTGSTLPVVTVTVQGTSQGGTAIDGLLTNGVLCQVTDTFGSSTPTMQAWTIQNFPPHCAIQITNTGAAPRFFTTNTPSFMDVVKKW